MRGFGSMAIASAVGAKKEYLYTSITLVVDLGNNHGFLYSVCSKTLNLNPGIAGAWVGTSEFADAAGFAAASAVWENGRQ